MKFKIIFFHLLFICTDAQGNWIITEDERVQDQYFEFQIFANDEFDLLEPDILDELCSQLRGSKIYQYIPFQNSFPAPFNLGLISGSSEKKNGKQQLTQLYRKLPLKSHTGKIMQDTWVYRCQTHQSKIYWLTNAYSHRSLFLLQEVDEGRSVSIVGKGERIPKADEERPRGKLLDTYFLQAYQSERKGYSVYQFVGLDTEDMKIHQKATSSLTDYFVNAYETSVLDKMDPMNRFVDAALFRLCCLVHATRQAKNPDEEQFSMNYAGSDPLTKHHRVLVKTSDDEVGEQEREIVVTAVGCAINRKTNGQINFYISADKLAEDLSAVFVLDMLDEDEKNGEKRFFVAERIRGIPFQCRYAVYYLWKRLLSTS